MRYNISLNFLIKESECSFEEVSEIFVGSVTNAESKE